MYNIIIIAIIIIIIEIIMIMIMVTIIISEAPQNFKKKTIIIIAIDVI